MPPSRREELMEAAIRVFCRDGYQATNIDRVIQEAGICRMTLYNHFKSKEELILAALRRHDETLRADLAEFAGSRSTDPLEQLLAVVEWHEQWFASPDFRGCMFSNASAEFTDETCEIRAVAAEHKTKIRASLEDLCKRAGLADPSGLAWQLDLLLEGAIARAQSMCMEDGEARAEVARRARAAAERLIEAACEAPAA